jgi:sarcosine oxidase
MPESVDTLIVGLGAMGSSACYHLARRGVRVLGLDQFLIAHDRGSSHGLSRMIRMCYYEHPDYVPLLRRAYELWRTLESESGERLLFTPGGVYMGREDAEAIAGSRLAAVEHGLAHEMLTRADLARRFPQFALPENFVGLFEPTAGWLAPERAIAAHARLARQHGADIRTDERVESWEADERGVRVRTVRAEYRARTLIIAAGAWAGRVVTDLGVAVSPTRQTLGWFSPPDPAPFASPDAPVWAMQTPKDWDGRGDLFYGFPMSTESPTGTPSLKLARHAKGPPIDPDRDGREPHPGDQDDIRPFLRRFMPGADGPLVALRACMYENSPDSHFIIDRHPTHPNVIIAAGFSGHGFKFACVVGEVLADLAASGQTRHPIGFLGLHRFRQPA